MFDLITACIRRMGEGNVFSLFTSWGSGQSSRGGVRSVQPGGVRSVQPGGGGQVSPTGGGQSSQGGGQVSPAGGGSVQPGGGSVQPGGVSILGPLAAVCLLRSRRRTFLFNFVIVIKRSDFSRIRNMKYSLNEQ